MKTETHTVTLPVDEYNKMRDFYENRELYDVALSTLIENISAYIAQEDYNRAKNLLLKKGIEMVIAKSDKYGQKFEFAKVKKS